MRKSFLSVVACLCLLNVTHDAAAGHRFGIVASVVKAGISPAGDVAGERTDLLINLRIDMDPAVPGLSLEPGDEVLVTLPRAFVLDDTVNFPIANIGSSPSCAPGNVRCTTGVLLHGWPQNPLPPSSYNFNIVDNVVSYTATGNVGPNPFGPGVKQIHIIGNGMRNPMRPGRYPVYVEIRRGERIDRGVGHVRIRPHVRPSINPVSAFDVPPDDPNGSAPPNPNFIYQQTAPGQPTPLIWNFLLWDGSGDPFTGVEIRQRSRRGGVLVQNGRTVGRFRIFGPHRATGQKLVSLGPSQISGTPIVGMTFDPPLLTGRLRAQFTAGSRVGRYYIFLQLNGGSGLRMVVDATK